MRKMRKFVEKPVFFKENAVKKSKILNGFLLLEISIEVRESKYSSELKGFLLQSQEFCLPEKK